MPTGKRESILAAALPLLLDGGAFSVDKLLKAAGAGIGTFYHHFPQGKEDLEAALRGEVAREYEEGLARVLGRNRDAETGVKALVHHHLRWTAERPAAARLLLEQPKPPGPELRREVRDWAARAGLVGVSHDLLLAVWTGPVREWSRGRGTAGAEASADRLAVAAWAAVQSLALG